LKEGEKKKKTTVKVVKNYSERGFWFKGRKEPEGNRQKIVLYGWGHHRHVWVMAERGFQREEIGNGRGTKTEGQGGGGFDTKEKHEGGRP